MLVLTCLDSLTISIDTEMMKQIHSLFIMTAVQQRTFQSWSLVRNIKSNQRFLRIGIFQNERNLKSIGIVKIIRYN